MRDSEWTYLVKVFNEDDECIFNDHVDGFCELDAIMNTGIELVTGK